MQKCEVHENQCKVEATGNAQVTSVEIGYLIGSIYSALRDADKDEAYWFRMCIEELMADGSPVWDMEGEGVSMVVPVSGEHD